MRLFKKLKEAKEERRLIKERSEKWWLKSAQKEIYLEEAEMQLKPCPFMNNSCSDKCAHFRKGKVTQIFDGMEIVPVKISPKCKLWK